MAKVRCAKCGEIFPLQSVDIQVCPVCNCRMRIKTNTGTTKPESVDAPKDSFSGVSKNPAVASDEYEALRNEYLELMRVKISENKDSVSLPRGEYEALVAKAEKADKLAEEASEQAETIRRLSSEIQRLKGSPVASVSGTAQNEVEPGVMTAGQKDGVASERGEDESSARFKNAESANKPYAFNETDGRFGQSSDENDELACDKGYRSNEFETPPHSTLYETELTYQCFKSDQEIRNGKNKVFNWGALIASGVAMLCAVALLFLNLGGSRGLALLLPETLWAGTLPFDPVVAFIFFLPALAFVLCLIGILFTGKIIKFVVGAMDIIGGLLIFETNAFTAVSASWAQGKFFDVDFSAFIHAFTSPNVFLLIVAAVCVLAGVLDIIFGALINKRVDNQ